MSDCPDCKDWDVSIHTKTTQPIWLFICILGGTCFWAGLSIGFLLWGLK